MRNLIGMLVALGLMILPQVCHAAGVAAALPLETFSQSPDIAIPVGPNPGEASVEFPAVPRKDGKVFCARFRASLAMNQPGGWNPYLQFKLNGNLLTDRVSTGAERLLNRGPWCQTTIDGNRSWWGGANDTLLTFFGPLDGPIDPRILSSRDEDCWYVLNLSDAVSYLEMGADNRVENDKPNKLVFRNLYARLDSGETAACHEMRIADLAFGYLPAETVSQLRPIPVRVLPKLAGQTIRSGAYTLTFAPTGAMELRIGSDRYLVHSEFSFPANPMGFHQFSWEKAADSDWKVRISGAKVIGECARYRVSREIKPDNGKFRVFDTITNKSAEPLGMCLRNYLEIPGMAGSGDYYLAGQKGCRADGSCPTNPTIFVRQASSSTGVVVEDDLFRLQLALSTTGNSFQFGTEHFGLRPGASYTAEWTLYPSGNQDYYGFVNRVRKDWGVNHTIPGGFVFSDASVIPERKVALYAVAPWFCYSNGAQLDFAGYKATLGPMVKKLLKADPNAIPLAMIETNLIAQDRRKLARGEEIPTYGGRDGGRGNYGLALTAKQTEVLKSSPWFDSLLKTDDGCAIIDTYYASEPYFDLMVYPAPGNSQLKYMIRQTDYALDEVGFRGIYLDQFTLAGGSLGNPDRRDFCKWDGHTVDLNERGEIERKYTDVSLMGISARAEIIRHAIKKGAVVVVNGHCPDRETRTLPFVRFAETEWGPWNPVEHLGDEPPCIDAMAEAHLDTPVHLGIRPNRFADEGKKHFAEIIHKWVIAGLKNGGLYYYYASEIPSSGDGAGEYGVVNHMFPFTPVELHEGWVMGKERILTARSGTFFWNHPQKPAVSVFDLTGKAISPTAEISRRGKGWAVKLDLKDWNEVAAIEAEAK